MKCPGQDTRQWKPGDIFEINCPSCGTTIEFFKDDIRRRCRKCRKYVPNPRLNLGCVEWCEYAEQCVEPEQIKKKKKEKVKQKE
ncbi:MAG: hypothetical protein ACLFVG_06085 [Candidatus Aminicenantes bacterium]